MESNAATPMLRQYHDLKQKYPGTLLFFRCGDFYEMFYDDAVTASRELEIVLTARNKERGNPVPMAGVPHHAAANHIAKLVKRGYRVAVCEQIEETSGGKKLIRREIARIITPGTAIDEQLLETKDSVYLAALIGAGEYWGAAFLELSTGEFRTTECKGKDAFKTLTADIESFAPREILFPESLAALVKETFTHSSANLIENNIAPAANSNVVQFPAKTTSANGLTATLTPLDDWLFLEDYCEALLKNHFGVKDLAGYGLADKTQAVRAAGACLRYVQETQRASASHIADINYFEANEFMVLDAVTLKNLELVESQSGGDKRRSLLGVIDATVTSMGSRLLKSWVLRPSIRRGEIEARLNAVDELCDSILRDKLRILLKEVADLERLIGRLNMNTASPRDLLALSRSLSQIPQVKKTLSDANASLLQVLNENLRELPEIKNLIQTAISENPPLNLSDGGTIRDGFSAELDEFRTLSRDAKQTIAAFEEQEKQRSGIASLRVKFNGVFGYFIEISKSNLSRVPSDYERRQTLVNAERYTTPQLKEWERKILGAEESILELETEIFQNVRAQVAAETKNLQTTARALATLDALASLAETACRRNYVRPQLNDGDEIEIKDGRHAVVEAFLQEPFVPNDLYLNNSTDRLLIITGPNMGGKCLRGNTNIFTDLGLVNLSELKPKEARLNEFSEISRTVKARDGKRTTTHFYCGGIQPTLKIKTRFGYEIEGTAEHRLWVRDSNGEERWVCLKDIKQGDFVAIDRKIELFGSQTTICLDKAENLKKVKRCNLPQFLNENLGYLLGLLVGDGAVNIRNGFALTTVDDFISNEFSRIIKGEFGYKVGRTRIAYRVSSKQIRVFLESLGLDYCRSFEKTVPEAVKRAPKEIVKAFLQGLFDTDGWAANSQVKVFLATSSKQLAHEVHLLLLNFGIVASLKEKKTPKLPSYQVCIYGADAIKFHQEIGFRLPRKQSRAALASSLRMPNVGIPHLSLTLKDVQSRIVATPNKKVSLKKNKSISSIFYTYLPLQRNLSYSKLNELINYCRENGVNCDDLEILQKQNYFYDEVKTIEAGEAEVFDLSVAQNPSYVANGFVSHNSTSLRQVAVIQILAQIGSFVPARTAKLPIVDRVWTRVGASDDLTSGRSTFMVEMTETAAILHNATPRSLVLLDEIGRGTSTFDGLSIAWAVAEYLHDAPEHAAKTLFATHYHELTELAERLAGAQNYQITASERNGEVIFLHKLERGKAEQSYGIAVARLAGLPPEVLARAREVLERLEKYEIEVFADVEQTKQTTVPENSSSYDAGLINGLNAAARRAARNRAAMQATLFQTANEVLIEELRKVNIELLSPEDLRGFLNDLQKRIV